MCTVYIWSSLCLFDLFWQVCHHISVQSKVKSVSGFRVNEQSCLHHWITLYINTPSHRAKSSSLSASNPPSYYLIRKCCRCDFHCKGHWLAYQWWIFNTVKWKQNIFQHTSACITYIHYIRMCIYGALCAYMMNSGRFVVTSLSNQK